MITSRVNKFPCFFKKSSKTLPDSCTAVWVLIMLHSCWSTLQQEPLPQLYSFCFRCWCFYSGGKQELEFPEPSRGAGAALVSLGAVPCNQPCVLCALLLPLHSHTSCHLLDFHLTWPFLTLGNWQMKEGLVWNRSFGSEFFKFADKLSGWILPLPQKKKLSVIANLQPAMIIVFEAQCHFFSPRNHLNNFS